MLQTMQGDLDMDTDEYQPLMSNNTPSRNRPKGAIRVNPVSPASDEVLDDEDTAADSTRYYSVNSLTRNFYATSLAFSLNMGCATCCVTYATSLLGKHLGSVSSGLLFALYAVSSFMLSKPVVTMVGPKSGLICGVVGQTIYICGFFVSTLLYAAAPSIAWTVSVTTSCIGGVAGGLLWTSQGVYFSRHASLFAQSTSQDAAKVTTDFSAVFAVVLLTAEMLAKALSSLLFFVFGQWGLCAVVGFFTVAAGVSCVIITRIKSLDETGTWDFSYTSISRDIGAVARLVWMDARLAALLPMQMAFGYSAGYVPYYFFGTIATESSWLGTGAVGLLSAIVVLSGALAAIPTAYAANVVGKGRVISIGALCLTAVGWPLFVFSDEELGNPLTTLCLLATYGVGRGIWEVINKAVLVDFFAQDTDSDKVAAAFSAASFANGYASGMGFLMFPYLTRMQMAGLCVGGTLFSLVTYLFGFRLQRRRLEITALNAERDARLDDIRKQGRNSRMIYEQQQQQKQQQQQRHQGGRASAREDRYQGHSDNATTPGGSTAQVLATFGHSGFGLGGLSSGRDAVAGGGGGMNLLGAFKNINVGQSHRVKKRKPSPAKGSAGKDEAFARPASPLASALEYDDETASGGRHTSPQSPEEAQTYNEL